MMPTNPSRGLCLRRLNLACPRAGAFSSSPWRSLLEKSGSGSRRRQAINDSPLSIFLLVNQLGIGYDFECRFDTMRAVPDPGVHPQAPTISAVVISRNEGPELESTVRNLLQTVDSAPLEMIVVDDGSTDNSTAFLAGLPDVHVVRSNGQGVARSRNLGAAQASGDIVLFADAHVRAPENWHAAISEALRDEAVGSVSPGVSDMSQPQARGFGQTLSGADLKATWLRKSGNTPYAAPILPGCFLALRRETFRQCG